MKPILLILLLTVSVSAQETVRDVVTGITTTTSPEVRLYRNSGGLLLYRPDEVSAQLFIEDKSDPMLSLRVNSLNWQFTKACEVYFLADGERFDRPCKLNSYRAYRLRRDIYVTEVITVQTPDLIKIVNAKDVVMKVGYFEFKVKEKDLKTLRKALGNP